MNARDFTFEPNAKIVERMQVLAGIGAATLVAGLFLAPQRIWLNLLLVSYYLLGLALAGMAWIAIQYVSGAHWSTALRRVPEAMAGVLPLGALGIICIVILHPSLYPWTGGVQVEGDAPGFKLMWLSLPFFRIRAVAYLLGWLGFAWAMLRLSRQQDSDGELSHTRRSTALAALFLVFFGVTFWLASVDWIMSLEPEWYSTIFGFYNFAGAFLSGLATLAVLLVWLRGHGPLKSVIREQHLHDVGKLLFAFSTFWAYLWFSQYMLIWYANLPDETVYYVRRLHGFWQPLFVLNLFLNWVVPFFALLPRMNKQRAGILVRVSIVLLAGRWLDLYLMIMPPFSGGKPHIGIWEIGLVAGLVGVFGLGFFAALRRAPLVPVRDPYLAESLHYHA
ncbi:MAG TPA: hypothetical protein VGS27_30830 [Candidatus Sulfotelmatobacter sp.]|nr:hypothetical protein [Candidatus Sulfotelmatobacter sp.]